MGVLGTFVKGDQTATAHDGDTLVYDAERDVWSPGTAAAGIQRLTLTGDKTVDVSAWDHEQIYVLVVTQDAAGNRAVKIDGQTPTLETTARGETVVVCVWTGTAWMVRSSAGSAAAAVTEPPAWSAGTTATTGTPAFQATSSTWSVPVTFSSAIPRGTLQVSYDAGTSWTTIAAANIDAGRMSATLTDLPASSSASSYAAPSFRVFNTVGASAKITAQPFTTPIRPKTFQPSFLAEFAKMKDGTTTPDGTSLSAYKPQVGSVGTVTGSASAVIVGGVTQLNYVSTNYAQMSFDTPLSAGNLQARLTVAYDLGAQVSNQRATAMSVIGNTSISQNIGVTLSAANGINVTTNGTKTETTGNTTMPPLKGTAVLTVDGTPGVMTWKLEIDGALARQGTFTWSTNYGAPTYLTTASFGLGGGDLHSTVTTSGVHLSKAIAEEWK